MQSVVNSPGSAFPDGVHILNPLEVADWDATLGQFAAATFFHTAAWARVLHGTYGYQPLYFTEVASGRFVSLLPVMEIDSWLTGRRGISLPFTDECAPLGDDAVSFQHLLEQILVQAGKRGWKYWEGRGGRSFMGDAPASTSFYGHRLVLLADEAALFARVDSSVRRAVRKAEQSGLSIEFSQEMAAVRDFHVLLGKTRQRHGVPVQPFDFFANIQRHVLAEKQGWVVLARQGGIPVAGAVFFHFGRGAIYKFGASDEAFQHLRANNLVMWSAIKRYASEGFTSFDFGRTSLDNEGLRRFKLGWGTQENLVEYFRHDSKAGRFVTARDESSGWHNHVFRRMPRFLSRFVGRVLYKHIA